MLIDMISEQFFQLAIIANIIEEDLHCQPLQLQIVLLEITMPVNTS